MKTFVAVLTATEVQRIIGATGICPICKDITPWNGTNDRPERHLEH